MRLFICNFIQNNFCDFYFDNVCLGINTFLQINEYRYLNLVLIYPQCYTEINNSEGS